MSMADLRTDDNQFPDMRHDSYNLPLDEQLRSAIAALTAAQTAPSEPKKEEKKEEKKKPEDTTPLFWKLCSAALLTVSAMIAVTLYNQLSVSSGQVRGDLGGVRSDIAQMRNELVPRTDYNLELKGTVDLIKEAQVKHREAAESWRQAMLEQKTLVNQLKSEIRDLERELQALRERQSLLERREPVVVPLAPKTPGK